MCVHSFTNYKKAVLAYLEAKIIQAQKDLKCKLNTFTLFIIIIDKKNNKINLIQGSFVKFRSLLNYLFQQSLDGNNIYIFQKHKNSRSLPLGCYTAIEVLYLRKSQLKPLHNAAKVSKSSKIWLYSI